MQPLLTAFSNYPWTTGIYFLYFDITAENLCCLSERLY